MQRNLEITLDDARARFEKLDKEYSECVAFKQSVEIELRDMNVRSENDLRMSEGAYNNWRRSKLKEKFNIERRLSQVKRDRHRWSNILYELKKVEKDASVADDWIKKCERLERENRDLKRQLAEADTKYTTLNRQYDAVIRQLNSIPKTMRSDPPAEPPEGG